MEAFSTSFAVMFLPRGVSFPCLFSIDLNPLIPEAARVLIGPETAFTLIPFWPSVAEK